MSLFLGCFFFATNHLKKGAETREHMGDKPSSQNTGGLFYGGVQFLFLRR